MTWVPTHDENGVEIPKCVDCNKTLQWATEIEVGNLCSNCGPGSRKHQLRESGAAPAAKPKIAPRQLAAIPPPVTIREDSPAPLYTIADMDATITEQEETLRQLRLARVQMAKEVFNNAVEEKKEGK